MVARSIAAAADTQHDSCGGCGGRFFRARVVQSSSTARPKVSAVTVPLPSCVSVFVGLVVRFALRLRAATASNSCFGWDVC